MPLISIIIPVLNEASCIEKTLLNLKQRNDEADIEILIADGGSGDHTQEIASKYASVIDCEKGRAKQLNTAARYAKGEILFFIHADMIAPQKALTRIIECITKEGYDGGGFSNVFDRHNKKIKRIGRILNFRIRDNDRSSNLTFFGDNGIFVKKTVFENTGGFKDIPIMEDYEFTRRLNENYRLVRIMEPQLIVSARRHEKSGFIKTRLQWIVIKKLFNWGVSPNRLAKWYKNVR